MGMQEVAIKMSLDAQSVVSSAQNISDAFSHITEKIKEAQEAGNMDLVSKYSSQAKSLQGLYNGMASGNGSNGGGFKAGAGSFMSGVNSASSSVQGAIGNFSNGDMMGGGLGLLAGGAGLAATFGGPIGLGVAAALAPVLAGGYIVKTLSEKYEDKIDEAMSLNARFTDTERSIWYEELGGKYEDFLRNNNLKQENMEAFKENGKLRYRERAESVKGRNTENIRNNLQKAMEAGASFGYSADEGIAQAKRLSEYGYNSDNVYTASKNTFAWAKSMGLAPSVLADFKGNMYRYGDKNADHFAQANLAGLFMGLKKGQFDETLRSLGDIFRDGINQGFTRSIGEIGSTLAFLRKASGDSKFFTGEEGAKRYRQLNDIVSNTPALDSVDKILRYRAIASMSEEEKKKILKEHGVTYSGNYQDNFKIAQLGLIPETFKGEIEEFKKVYGQNNTTELIEYLTKTHANNNYIEGQRYFEIYQNMNKKEIEKGVKNPYYTDLTTVKTWEDNINEQSKLGASLPDYSSTEKDIQSLKRHTENAVTTKGMDASELKNMLLSFFQSDDSSNYYELSYKNSNIKDVKDILDILPVEDLINIKEAGKEYNKANEDYKWAMQKSSIIEGIEFKDEKEIERHTKAIEEAAKNLQLLIDNLTDKPITVEFKGYHRSTE